MRIGELARRTGVSERALRYYEEQGLLRPERRASGYRVYHQDDVRQVRHIRLLLAAGLNTGTIAEILPCMLADDDTLVPGCPEVAEILLQDRDRLSSAIEGLSAARRILDAIIAGGRTVDVSDPVGEAVG
ncbi:MerR family transcriptional regulator [Plantactinospora sonchi]|uniref:MerR family transcriptional regulator n=1 Tax=Plantactinospora sonchi TaxID=1544735 RepID=A0ABU7RMQ7_9ACTN